jgi:hypothetical protein
MKSVVPLHPHSWSSHLWLLLQGVQGCSVVEDRLQTINTLKHIHQGSPCAVIPDHITLHHSLFVGKLPSMFLPRQEIFISCWTFLTKSHTKFTTKQAIKQPWLYRHVTQKTLSETGYNIKNDHWCFLLKSWLSGQCRLGNKDSKCSHWNLI